MATFDPRTPSIARVYDYLLGGKDNYAADRAVAQKLIAVYPPIIETVPESRRFVERAVTWAAEQGITQFIDLGAGLPTAPNTHVTAQAASPAAAVAYVDNDPVVISHLTADFASFFGDLQIVPPGLGDARRIRPGWSDLASAPKRPDRILAGIVRAR